MTTAFSTLDMRTYLSYLATKKQVIAKAEMEEDEKEEEDDEKEAEEGSDEKRKNMQGERHDVQRAGGNTQEDNDTM